MDRPAFKLRSACLVLCLASSAAAHAQDPTYLLKLPVPATDKTLHYGPDKLQFGELRLSQAKGPAPIVLLVHGGCWADHFEGYDPRITSYDLLKPLAAALTKAGAATWNIEYRRSGSLGGSWANTYLDIAAATDYLRKLAPDNHLDLSRIVVVGHSSGGQLALWLGARSKLSATSAIYTKDPISLTRIFDLDGPPDLAAAQPLENDYCPIPAISRFMEGTPAAQPQRYHDGSAQNFLPLGIPQTIVSAGLLLTQPDLVDRYQKAAEAKGDLVTVIEFKGASHFDPLDPNTASGKLLVKAVLESVGLPN
jgi:acetyl esterase/lipase